jgi:hypothetical protein
MRFRADGPSIPVELLEQRDKGNVVFFCGAGVSKPAGLPSFSELAERVIKALGTDTGSKSRALLEQGDGPQNLDRVFNLLHQEYKREEVNEAVNRILRTPRSANTSAHATILRLSRSSTGRPQVVTTNFDHLFERADKSLRVHIGPALPDIRSVGSFEGLVYLHGRSWRSGRPGSSGRKLILSSSDFGRAYLADGWATRFVRELLQNYFIVLVGYSASDPPVRYLLEGLHSRRESRSSTIFAFDHGEFDEVMDRWRSLGVHALPYQALSDPSHAALWNTLSAWAVRADDPDEWRRSIVNVAQRDPAQLQPFERGQVVALVRTSDGAAAFATATPPPSAEWLCVFDRGVRYAQPQRGFGEQDPDPLSLYGLDDDPPRTEIEGHAGGQNDEPLGFDVISVLVEDERSDRHKRLGGVGRRQSDGLPERLMHLAGWFGRVADQPSAIWWAAGYDAIHPQLLATVDWHRRRGEAFSEIGRRAWDLLLERFAHAPEHPHADGWYPCVWRMEREGWTESILREFERAATPYVVARRPSSRRLAPPSNEDASSLVDCIDFDVRFPGYERKKLNIPPERLARVFEIARRGLYRAATLLAETNKQYWRTASFVESDEPGTRYLNDASKYLHWTRHLFDRLATESPEEARDELRRWPVADPYFFAKLAIYGWGLVGLTDAREAAQALLGIPDEQFWNDAHRRELLHSLRARWNAFEAETRRELECRIVAGHPQWEWEAEGEHLSRVRETAATMLGWLESFGCELSDAGRETLRKLKRSIPEWRDSWAHAADHSHDARAGSVATQSDPSALLAVPLSDVAETAERQATEDFHSLTRHEPFLGLVERHPRRAMAALSLELRRDRHPAGLWRDLLSQWPSDASDRLLCVCAGRLIRAPKTLLAGLQHATSWWFRKNAKRIANRSLDLSYRLFDRILDVTVSLGAQATESVLGDVSVGGKVLPRSRRTVDHAINSPVGHLTDGILDVLGGLDLVESSGLPDPISLRLETLMRAPGEGADYAVCLTARRLRWLHWLDPEWTRERLIPLFRNDHDLCEPAWNGLLQDTHVPAPQLFSLLKQHFLQSFESFALWKWEEHTRNKLVEFLVVACLWRQRNKAYVSYAEARTALRAVDDAARSHALTFLGNVVEETKTWSSFGRRFMQQAWPRESRFQTPGVARQLAFLAERSGDDFPDVVATILPLVVPTDQLDLTVHRVVERSEASLARRFPQPLLELLDRLVPEDPRPIPYDLGSVLTTIADASPSLRGDQRWRRLRRIADRG